VAVAFKWWTLMTDPKWLKTHAEAPKRATVGGSR